MNPSPFFPKPINWTPELVQRFWDFFAASPLTFMSFSRQICGKLVEHIQHIVDQGSMILDYGAGDGDLARGLLKADFFVGVYEQSSERTGAAHALLDGHPKFLGTVYPQSAIVFDAVCAFEVLEHILDEQIDDTLNTIRNFLGDSGVFLGTVPYKENLLNRQCICPECGVMFHRWQHVRSFDESSLYKLLQQGNFSNIQIFPASFSNSLAFVATPSRRK